MLVLTRKKEEKIVIGTKNKISIGDDDSEKIIITILKIQGDKVSIGIEANEDILIYRQELLQEAEEEVKSV